MQPSTTTRESSSGTDADRSPRGPAADPPEGPRDFAPDPGPVLDRGPAARIWSRAFAAAYDSLTRGAEEAGVAERRAALLEAARGDVLEIGAGTGANLEHYPAGLASLTLLEPDPAMRRRLAAKPHADGATIVAARAESLPLASSSVDTVVSTYVLCGVDQAAALAEIRRVLRPGGALLFCEHVRSGSQSLARWQDRLNRPWRALACGCNCNRATEAAIRAGGFEITELSRADQEKEIPLVKPTIWGRAAALVRSGEHSDRSGRLPGRAR